jgi:hypothetical protein
MVTEFGPSVTPQSDRHIGQSSVLQYHENITLRDGGMPWISRYMSCRRCGWRAQRSVRASVAIA